MTEQVSSKAILLANDGYRDAIERKDLQVISLYHPILRLYHEREMAHQREQHPDWFDADGKLVAAAG